MELTKHTEGQLTNDVISNWFDDLLSRISVDKMMMETQTAPPEKEQFYKNAINDDHDANYNMLRVQSTKYFISKLLTDYIQELASFKVVPQKLAFELSEAKILVWGQIKDGDESAEDALILSEAKANSKYNNYGFYISSTIVEESDSLPIPPHYHELKLDGRFSVAH
ncbi:hypothetical protein ACFQ3S_03475 [Mucilaginibacter terrae]|uniref:hypothetical protein n=1 Tax=Mucilaginibacter terrae TaxID=1955052 RepID=UPI003641B94D